MKDAFLVILFDILSGFSMRVSLVYVNPIVVDFINTRKEFTIKGITFIRNDAKFLIKSAHGKLIGEIQGLSGISPRKSLVISCQEEGLIPKIRGQIITAMEELLHVIKQVKYQGVQSGSKAVYTPLLVASRSPHSCVTKEFISKLSTPQIVSPTLMKITSY